MSAAVANPAPKPGLASVWTEAAVRLLVEHYRTGLSASESARLIGVSKNAAISKRRRLGLLATVGADFDPGAPANDVRRQPRARGC